MQTKTDNRVYAGFFVRLAAYLIDWLIVGVVLLIVRIPIWISALVHPDNLLVCDFIFQYSLADIILYVLTVAYFILLTYYTGATLGKRALHIRVISIEDRPMTFFEVVYRETVGKFLSGIIIGIGFLMIGIDKEKRGIHDLLADTRVIYYHEKKVYTYTPIEYRDKHIDVVTSRQLPSQHSSMANQTVNPMQQAIADQPDYQQAPQPASRPAEHFPEDSEM